MRNESAIAAQALDDVRRICREILGDGMVAVYLFGSWARGDATSLSDIDVVIHAHTPLASGTLARLRERLEDNHIPYRVEVVDLDDVDAAFRRRILEESVPWND